MKRAPCSRRDNPGKPSFAELCSVPLLRNFSGPKSILFTYNIESKEQKNSPQKEESKWLPRIHCQIMIQSPDKYKASLHCSHMHLPWPHRCLQLPAPVEPLLCWDSNIPDVVTLGSHDGSCTIPYPHTCLLGTLILGSSLGDPWGSTMCWAPLLMQPLVLFATHPQHQVLGT